MVTLPVYDRSGGKVGEYQVDPAEIAPRISKQLLHDAVVMYRANLRQGSHKTKSRAEVSGTTGKMYRQKGTGHARAGSRRSGLRRGGGHIFALRNRDYSYRLPRKALQAATRIRDVVQIAGLDPSAGGPGGRGFGRLFAGSPGGSQSGVERDPVSAKL